MTSPPSASVAPGPLPRSPGSGAPPQRADHVLAGKPRVFAYAIRSGRNGAAGPCVTLTVHVRAVEFTHALASAGDRRSTYASLSYDGSEPKGFQPKQLN